MASCISRLGTLNPLIGFHVGRLQPFRTDQLAPRVLGSVLPRPLFEKILRLFVWIFLVRSI
jgi:hypothetical protein